MVDMTIRMTEHFSFAKAKNSLGKYCVIVHLEVNCYLQVRHLLTNLNRIFPFKKCIQKKYIFLCLTHFRIKDQLEV